VKVSISVGVATILDSDRRGMEALLTAADEALYRAKAGGRNRVARESSTVRPSLKPDPRIGSVSE
jgi:diguanylate cyclase (GGDEF)-like protein